MIPKQNGPADTGPTTEPTAKILSYRYHLACRHRAEPTVLTLAARVAFLERATRWVFSQAWSLRLDVAIVDLEEERGRILWLARIHGSRLPAKIARAGQRR